MTDDQSVESDHPPEMDVDSESRSDRADDDATHGDEGEAIIENSDSDDVLIEFSLDDLGRAYAEAVGLKPKPSMAGSDPMIPAVDDPRDVADADNAACELSPKTILEAILFMGSPDGVKLTSRKIASMMRDVSAKEIHDLVKELNRDYEQQQAAYRINSDQHDLQLALVAEFEPIRQQFYGQVRLAKLNQSAIDVLSIVAYNQPVSAEDVDNLRTRPSGAILNQLVKRQLLEVISESTQRRTRLYKTTDRFLDLFGLESISDLPRAESDLELL